MYMLLTHPVNCVAFCAHLLRTRSRSCAGVTSKPWRRRGMDVYFTCSEHWHYAEGCVNLWYLTFVYCSSHWREGGVYVWWMCWVEGKNIWWQQIQFIAVFLMVFVVVTWKC